MVQESRLKPNILFKPSNTKKWVAILGISTLAIAAFSQYSQIISIFKSISPAYISSTFPESLESVTALGRIEPQGEVIQLSTSSSAKEARIEELLVSVGEKVHKGQIIAVLDTRPGFQAALTQAQKEVKIKQAELAKIISGAKQGEIQAKKAEIAKLRTQLQGATQAKQALIARLQAQLQRETEAKQALIARLNAQLQREIEAKQANITRIHAQIQRKTEAETAKVNQSKARLNRAREAQQANIDKLKAQLEEEIVSVVAKAKINRAQAEWENAQTEYKRNQELYNQGVVSVSQYESKALEVDTTRARLREVKAILTGKIKTLRQQIKAAKANLNHTMEAGKEEIWEAEAELNHAMQTGKEEIWEAEAELNHTMQTGKEEIWEAEAELNRTVEAGKEQIWEAKAELSRTMQTGKEEIKEAIATLEQITEIRSEDVDVAKAKVEQAIALVAKAKADLDLAVVKSPIDGQVLAINTQLGEKVQDSEGIVDLGQTDRMYVVAEVYKTDIERVSLGQRAVISSDAFPGSLQGIVDRIGMQIRKKDVFDTDTVAVKIRLDSDSSKKVTSLTNLQVDVQISDLTSAKTNL